MKDLGIKSLKPFVLNVMNILQGHNIIFSLFLGFLYKKKHHDRRRRYIL